MFRTRVSVRLGAARIRHGSHDLGVFRLPLLTIAGDRGALASEVVSMAVTVPAGDARVVAVRAALEPFGWQSFTAQLVCSRAVAAMDGGQAFPRPRGPSNGPSPQNECAEALVQVLNACRWRSLTVDRLSRLLVDAAQTWRQERAWFDIRLGLLLDGIG